MKRLLSIGAVAKQVGVSVQTLRHYDKLGFRPAPAADGNGGERSWVLGVGDYERRNRYITVKESSNA